MSIRYQVYKGSGPVSVLIKGDTKDEVREAKSRVLMMVASFGYQRSHESKRPWKDGDGWIYKVACGPVIDKVVKRIQANTDWVQESTVQVSNPIVTKLKRNNPIG